MSSIYSDEHADCVSVCVHLCVYSVIPCYLLLTPYPICPLPYYIWYKSVVMSSPCNFATVTGMSVFKYRYIFNIGYWQTNKHVKWQKKMSG